MSGGESAPILPEHLALFWAKLGSQTAGPRSYHPLLCHMIDVAAVAHTMWREALAAATRRRLAEALSLPEDEAGRWIAFFAGLHDLGKASPGFALQSDEPAARLRSRGYLSAPLQAKPPHGFVTARTVPAATTGLGPMGKLATQVAAVVGGHHGVFPRSEDLRRLSDGVCGLGCWREARRDLIRHLASALGLAEPTPAGALSPATAVALAGLVSVADWIGSAERFFPHAADDPSLTPRIDPLAYSRQARDGAVAALATLGWAAGATARRPLSFTELFPELAGPPRPVQSEAERLAGQLQTPCLVLVEAPMGEGKTEAALYLAEWFAASGDYHGCYFALPTMATSNQMFSRVHEFLAARYAGGLVNLQLLHGHAALSAEFRVLRESADSLLTPSGVQEGTAYDGASAGVVAAEWFTHRKRGLLAPFGVGTVDQALLGVLQTRHSFVRLFGLAGKTVIIDEAHAYEVYTTTLLERLLEWLAALGSPVVLLSATLPESKGRALLAAYARGLGLEAPDTSRLCARYPRLSWVDASGLGDLHVESSRLASRVVRLEWVDATLPRAGEAFGLGERLLAALSEGGCAVVICNTVNGAQRVYEALRPYFPSTAEDDWPELDLFHARFPFGERDAREKRALLRFGKPGGKVEFGPGDIRPVCRPWRAVLVATQVVEQSLDLDFDLMVSELAPVDFVLQRLGRLWRHDRGAVRHGLDGPVLWLWRPQVDADGVPHFGAGTELVYHPHILLRTWMELKERSAIHLPDDLEPLVETVYGLVQCPMDLAKPLAIRWQQTSETLHAKMEAEATRGLTATVLPPSYDLADVLEAYNRCLEEDDPKVHASLQAVTRLGPPSVRVVVLKSGESHLAEVGQPTSLAKVEALLRRSLEVAHAGLVPTLLAEPAPPGWARTALLRHLRLIQLDADDAKVVGRYRLRLDPALGLTIARLDKEEG